MIIWSRVGKSFCCFLFKDFSPGFTVCRVLWFLFLYVTTPPYLRLISSSLVSLFTYTCTTTPSLGLTPHSSGLDTAPHLLLLSDSTRSRTTFPLTHSLTHSASLHLLFSSIPCTLYKSMYCRLSPKLELFNITP